VTPLVNTLVFPSIEVDCNINEWQLAAIQAETDYTQALAEERRAESRREAAVFALQNAETANTLAKTLVTGAQLVVNATEDKLSNLTAVHLQVLAAQEPTLTQENAMTAVLTLNQTLAARAAILAHRISQAALVQASYDAAVAANTTAANARQIATSQREVYYGFVLSSLPLAIKAASTVPCVGSPCLNGGVHPSPLFAACTCISPWVGPLCAVNSTQLP
jgi:hypothetical protein